MVITNIDKVLDRAARDAAFRRLCLKAPTEAIEKATGSPPPAGVRIRFIARDSACDALYVLPDRVDGGDAGETAGATQNGGPAGGADAARKEEPATGGPSGAYIRNHLEVYWRDHRWVAEMPGPDGHAALRIGPFGEDIDVLETAIREALPPARQADDAEIERIHEVVEELITRGLARRLDNACFELAEACRNGDGDVVKLRAAVQEAADARRSYADA